MRVRFISISIYHTHIYSYIKLIGFVYHSVLHVGKKRSYRTYTMFSRNSQMNETVSALAMLFSETEFLVHSTTIQSTRYTDTCETVVSNSQ